MRSRKTAGNGFTLVEVMVAMAVVAVALPALLFALVQQIDGTQYLRDRTLASWVAANKLAELRLILAQQQALPSGPQRGEAQLADRDWYWWLRQETTQLPGFLRVEIRVALSEEDEEQPLQILTAFLAPEAPDAG